MNDLASRCQLTIDYRSKSYVEDAMDYARWILRLKDATPDERRKMLYELGAHVPQSIEDELSAWRVQLIEDGLVVEPKMLERMGQLLEIIAELRMKIKIMQNAAGN